MRECFALVNPNDASSVIQATIRVCKVKEFSLGQHMEEQGNLQTTGPCISHDCLRNTE